MKDKITTICLVTITLLGSIYLTIQIRTQGIILDNYDNCIELLGVKGNEGDRATQRATQYVHHERCEHILK